MQTLFAYRGERLVQAVEDMIGTDDLGQAVTVEIGLQGRLHVYKHQHDASTKQKQIGAGVPDVGSTERLKRYPRPDEGGRQEDGAATQQNAIGKAGVRPRLMASVLYAKERAEQDVGTPGKQRKRGAACR